MASLVLVSSHCLNSFHIAFIHTVNHFGNTFGLGKKWKQDSIVVEHVDILYQIQADILLSVHYSNNTIQQILVCSNY